MKEHLRDFLEHLRLNRNASPHTVSAYDSDVSQFLDFTARHLGKPRRSIVPTDLDLALGAATSRTCIASTRRGPRWRASCPRCGPSGAS
jgi:site-specific recombinase XerD